MKKSFTLLFIVLALSSKVSAIFAQAANTQDSLALVDLYDSANGVNWAHGSNTNWLTTQPLYSWAGVSVTGTRVTNLQLVKCNLKGIIPASFGNLTQLTNVDFSNNHLRGAIPSSIGNLTLLTGISLGGNNLSGSIPASLGNLVNLVTLSLNDNVLTGNIPARIVNFLNLDYLNLSDNGLSGTIPPKIGQLTKITYLILNNNQLSGTIPSSIGNILNLSSIYLNNNQLTGSIPSTLKNLLHLSTVNFADNNLTGKIPDSLGKIGTYTFFQTLDLSGNQLEGAIPGSFNSFEKDAHINLSSNKFTFTGIQRLAKYFSAFNYFAYSPQAIIPLHKNGNSFSVSAGGTIALDSFRWYKNGVLDTLIVGDSVFTTAVHGSYSVAVTNAVAKSLTLYSDTITVSGLVALNNEKQLNNEISALIFPDPVKDILSIQLKNITGNGVMILFDNSGRILKQQNINLLQQTNAEMNVSGFSPGIYLIQIKTRDKIIKQKFMKE